MPNATPEFTRLMTMILLMMSPLINSCSVYRSGDREYFDSNAKAGAPTSAALAFGPSSARLIRAANADCGFVDTRDLSPSTVAPLDLSDQTFDSAIVEFGPKDQPKFVVLAASKPTTLDIERSIICRVNIGHMNGQRPEPDDLTETRLRMETLVLTLAQSPHD